MKSAMRVEAGEEREHVVDAAQDVHATTARAQVSVQ
jgi:hypothetical protein